MCAWFSFRTRSPLKGVNKPKNTLLISVKRRLLREKYCLLEF